MNTYIDSSVLLRIVLGARGALADWRSLEPRFSSALLEVECLRTLDRLRHVDGITGEQIATRRQSVHELLAGVTLVSIDSPVIARASESFSVPLKILDAIHLATALVWRDATREEVNVATHDGALALAARAVGLEVLGA